MEIFNLIPKINFDEYIEQYNVLFNHEIETFSEKNEYYEGFMKKNIRSIINTIIGNYNVRPAEDFKLEEGDHVYETDVHGDLYVPMNTLLRTGMVKFKNDGRNKGKPVILYDPKTRREYFIEELLNFDNWSKEEKEKALGNEDTLGDTIISRLKMEIEKLTEDFEVKNKELKEEKEKEDRNILDGIPDLNAIGIPNFLDFMPGGNQLMPMDCLPPVNASERLAKELNLLEVEIKKKSNELKTKNKIDCRNILSRIQILPNIEPIKNYSQYINGGDYVDRGRQSETVINMFAYLHRQCIDNNISPPKLVLGNHEVFYMTNDLDLAIFNGANHTFSPKSYAGSVFAPEVTIKKLQAKSEIIRGGIKDAMFTLACNVGTTIFSHAAISNIALIDLETYLREFQPQIEKSKMKTEKKNYFRVTSKELIECFQNINEKIVKYYAERKEPLSEADITSVVKALNRFNIMEMHLIEERATMTDLEQDLEQSISNLIDIMKGSESDNRHVGKITWQRKFGTSIDNLLPGATNVLGHDASPSHENMMPDPEFDCRVIYGDACRSNGYGTTANRITDDIGGTALISKVVSAIFRKGFNSNDENTQFNVKKIGVYSHEMREDILEIKARTNYQKLSLENETKTENSLPINSVLSEDDKMVIVYGKEFSLDKIEYENNHSSNLLPQLTVVREINANGKAGMYKINYSTTSSDAANKAGMGECRYCDGNKYAGEFFGTDRDGYGICTYPDGSVNFGAWSKNRENGYGILIDTNDDIRLAHWENGTLKTQKKIYNVNNIIKYAEKSENISPELKKEVNILKPTVYMDGRIALGSRIDANGKKYGLTVNKNGDIRIGEYGDKVIIDDEESKPVDHITVDLENKQKRVSKKVSEKTLLEVNKILDNKVWNQKFANKPMEMKEKLQPKSKVANKLQKFSGLKEFDDKKTSVTLEDLM